MQDAARQEIKLMKEWLVDIRRTIHMHPELMYQEEDTSKLVAHHLKDLGLEFSTGIGKTGVVGLLRGAKEGKTIAIRADMDALPIEEATAVPYASKIPGRMHACGHDAHTAILLGVARFFSSRRNQLKGNIKWIFQPAEEGGAGADAMIKDGVLENPKVDAIFGAHVFQEIPLGKIGVSPREAFASSDHVSIEIIGKGGHGAYPHLAHDPILAAAHLVAQIHSVVSRNVPPLENAVISFGKIAGGQAFNVIPDSVELMATVRALTPEVRTLLNERIAQICRGIELSFGVECRLNYKVGYPPLVNNSEMAQLIVSACGDAIGEENIEFPKPTMGAEDFAFYLGKVPGAIFRLGIRNEAKGIIHPIHSSLFNIDEDVLPFGVEMFVQIISQYLDLQL
jgi:amidohydrolase